MGQEDEVHGRGGRQVGRSADEHSGAQSREGQEQTRNVGSDFAQDALETRTNEASGYKSFSRTPKYLQQLVVTKILKGRLGTKALCRKI